MATKIRITDGDDSFEAFWFDNPEPAWVAVFAVGAGGNPERHLPLLTALSQNRCRVIAPHFERLIHPTPSEDELRRRALRIGASLDRAHRRGIPVVGIGHSIGGAALLALAGAQMWLGPGRRVEIPTDERIERLVLMAPATGFFQTPHALDDVRAPILSWVGSEDHITPPSQVEILETCFKGKDEVDVRVVAGAGHFTFMHTLPPQVLDPFPDRLNFLEGIGVEILRFLMA